MDYTEYPAPPPLDRWVRCFWFLRGSGAGLHPVVPDGRIEIVVHLGDPFLELEAAGTETRQESVVLSGQLSRPLYLAPGPMVDVVGIRFRTATARACIALPLGELQDRVVSLDQVDARLARALLLAARSAEPVASLSRVLLECIAMRVPDPGMTGVVRQLDAGWSVAAVARDKGMTVRTLERRLVAEIGLAPKLLQRVLRFRRLHGLLDNGMSGARAAAASGYFDQSHAARDFRSFTGTSPARHFGAEYSLARSLMSHSS